VGEGRWTHCRNPYHPRGTPRSPLDAPSPAPFRAHGGEGLPRAGLENFPFEDALKHSKVVLVIQQGEPASRRLSDVSRAQPGDVTLQNLLGVLVAKLDTCRRLPIFEYEAGSEGYAACSKAFRDLADAERASVNELLACLQDHLTETGADRKGSRT
jgi:hypothetical protein